MTATSQTTMLLDANLWRYIVDEDSVEVIRKAARAADVKIVACPAVVYECLRTGDPIVRASLAKALTRQAWLRPMPEAFVEALDLRVAIQRLRLQWLTPNPDLRMWRKNRADWQGGFWRRVRANPTHMPSTIEKLGASKLADARNEATALRSEARNLKHSTNTLSLANATARFVQSTPG